MTKDTRDALAISAFFAGYALVLAVLNRVPTFPKRIIRVPIDMNRLVFLRSQRERLISEENRGGIVNGIIDGITAATDGD